MQDTHSSCLCTAKNGNTPNGDQLWSIHTIKYNIAIKNKLLICSKKVRSRTAKTRNTGEPDAEEWSHRSSPSLLVGAQNGSGALEKGLAVSYKTKHTLTIRSSNHPEKPAHDVYGSFTHNRPSPDAPQQAGERINQLWRT